MANGFTSSSFEFGDPPQSGIAQHSYLICSQVDGQCDQLLCDDQGQLLLIDQPTRQSLQREYAIAAEEYLGLKDACAYWVLVLEGQPQIAQYLWSGLRALSNQIPSELFALAGRALQMAQWPFDHKFCGRCGNPTGMDSQDKARVCPQCALRFYPRISPCMIVLVRRGRQLLLARHQRSNRPVYSTLAGFVEAGESVEQTVHREVREEVGLYLAQLEYFRSQSWPFPGQLMLGFFADYREGEIAIDQRELVDAQWFEPEQLPEIPSLGSIAGQLIREHLRRCGLETE